MRPSRPSPATLLARSKDPQSAALYLEEALAAGDSDAFKLALRNVAEARLGGMSALSERTQLNREALYRSLSESGNPTLETLTKVMRARPAHLGHRGMHGDAPIRCRYLTVGASIGADWPSRSLPVAISSRHQSAAPMASASRVPHIRFMVMRKNSSVQVTVGRDAKTGRMIPGGYGALKGQYIVREGVDLTKPIYKQVSKRSRRKAAPKKVGKD